MLHSVSKEEVLDTWARLYPYDIENGIEREAYGGIFDALLETQPIITKCEIGIDLCGAEENGVPYYDVYGQEPGCDNAWAMEFCPWGEWLEMKIKAGTAADDMGDAEIVAHCLAEIAWGGFSEQDMEAKLRHLKEQADAKLVERGEDDEGGSVH